MKHVSTPFEFWGAYVSSMQSLTEANLAMASRYWKMTSLFTGMPVDSAEDMVNKMTAISQAFSPVRTQSPCGVAPARKPVTKTPAARKAKAVATPKAPIAAKATAPKRAKTTTPSPKDA